jgi:hypothetical protein
MMDRNQPAMLSVTQDQSPAEANNRKGEATVKTLKKILVRLGLITVVILVLSAVCSASAVWT